MTNKFNADFGPVPPEEVTPQRSEGRATGLQKKPFHYDAQIKRYLLQILALFSGYQVVSGIQRDGKRRFMNVPVLYGDISRTAGYILQGGNENTMTYLPVMSVSFGSTPLRLMPSMRLQPQHVEKTRYIERRRDQDGRPMVGVMGKGKIAETYQAVPYQLSFEVGIWSPNADQGLQIAEQIMTQFNPSLDLMISNAPLDPAFLTVVTFEGSLNLERVEVGTEVDPLYRYTMGFNTPVWLSPPAKVYDAKLIEKIHVPILDFIKGVEMDDLEQIDKLVISASEDEIILIRQQQEDYTVTPDDIALPK